jgi:hypothetical protein
MPTFRLEKFTIIPSYSRYRRPGLESERAAHLAKIQSKANSRYAIKKTGVNIGSGRTDSQRPGPAGALLYALS